MIDAPDDVAIATELIALAVDRSGGDRGLAMARLSQCACTLAVIEGATLSKWMLAMAGQFDKQKAGYNEHRDEIRKVAGLTILRDVSRENES